VVVPISERQLELVFRIFTQSFWINVIVECNVILCYGHCPSRSIQFIVQCMPFQAVSKVIMEFLLFGMRRVIFW